jgi:hypothetical protein
MYNSPNKKRFLNIQLLYFIITIKMNNIVVFIEFANVKRHYFRREANPCFPRNAGVKKREAKRSLPISLSDVVHN